MPAETKKPGPSKLGRASESGDPAVHQVLAELQVARRNDNAAAVKELTDRLAELGYE